MKVLVNSVINAWDPQKKNTFPRKRVKRAFQIEANNNKKEWKKNL